MVTIKDIAKAAGVSHTTVSRALNNNPVIKPETRKKIQQLAESMNYVPNVNARSLVNQKNYMIGLFFSSIEEGTSASFLVEAITAINSVLDESYSLSVKGIDQLQEKADDENLQQQFEKINLHRYDGIIVMSQSDTDADFIGYVKEQQIPLVVLNRQIDDPAIVNVSTDDSAGVAGAIDYAISLGHTRIGFIGGKRSFLSSKKRREGLIASMEKHRLPINDALFLDGDYSIHSGFAEMKKLIDLAPRLTLVFCANDDMAIGALRAANEAGIRVPEDVSLIGFDDTTVVSYLNPPLTTVHKPIGEISRKGTELLLQMISGSEIQQKHHLLSTTLKVRKSLRKL